MQNLLRIIFLSFFLSTGIYAEHNIDSLYNQFNKENISADKIQQWLNQFDLEDRDSATLLLQQIEYFSYPRVMDDLQLLHKKLLTKLKIDGFIANTEKEMVFKNVDFSKTYPAKSGDLISYFYRSSNLIRAVCFKNLSDLSLLAEKESHSDKALILLEDYVGTGTQFLLGLYAKQYHELFNNYKKVYLVVLVATKNAIHRFEKAAHADHHSLAQDFISILGIQDENAKQEIFASIKNILKHKLEIIYLHEEVPLDDSLQCPITTNKILTLLNKYNIKRYLEGNFSSFGRTVFFYNCPNNLPEILWNSQSIQRDGTPWIPLFKRVEDVSIYDMSKTIPIEEQIW